MLVRDRFRPWTISVFVTWFMAVAQAQVGTPIASRFPGPEESFAVASVKVNRSGNDRWDFDWDLRIAGPEWIKTARFDVDATTPASVTQDRAMSMLRRLLAERFGLKVHYESRERPVYGLVLARTDRRLGPQLTPNPIDCTALGAAIRDA